MPCVDSLIVHGGALTQLACRMAKKFTEKVASHADKKVGHFSGES